MNDTMSALDKAMEHARKVGHVLESDPPAAITAVRRWTCRKCGRALLINGHVVFGSIRTNVCVNAPEPAS